ncbi:hypothetical protein GCM10018785_56340 [Streptomyces longispororuber]|uniref:Uncharacterized protein n=1 Tax=Streptomyces longispororuber TaxID=68230 RepID=A0A918ZZR9_9ACTN|nr:hypothetical protein GCM10018785_56340 [Streptomyces longispororuber]
MLGCRRVRPGGRFGRAARGVVSRPPARDSAVERLGSGALTVAHGSTPRAVWGLGCHGRAGEQVADGNASEAMYGPVRVVPFFWGGTGAARPGGRHGARRTIRRDAVGWQRCVRSRLRAAGLLERVGGQVNRAVVRWKPCTGQCSGAAAV